MLAGVYRRKWWGSMQGSSHLISLSVWKTKYSCIAGITLILFFCSIVLFSFCSIMQTGTWTLRSLLYNFLLRSLAAKRLSGSHHIFLFSSVLYNWNYRMFSKFVSPYDVLKLIYSNFWCLPWVIGKTRFPSSSERLALGGKCIWNAFSCRCMDIA